MLILVFDTSMKNGTVGWMQLEESSDSSAVKDWAHMCLPAVPGHAERLIERIDVCLKSGGFSVSDVDLIVLGKGPGTFTGLRIGFSTAKSLSLVNQIPMVTVSTLEMLACNARRSGNVAAILDARRKEVYLGVYAVSHGHNNVRATLIGDERVVKPENVASEIEKFGISLPIQMVGDGAVSYANELTDVGVAGSMAHVGLNSYVMALRGYEMFKFQGAVNTATAEPEYLREPDARKPKSPFETVK